MPVHEPTASLLPIRLRAAVGQGGAFTRRPSQRSEARRSLMSLAIAACVSTAHACGAADNVDASANAAAALMAGDRVEAVMPCPDSVAKAPAAGSHKIPPTILDRRAALAAIDRAYPPELRAEGVEGTVRLWFLVNIQGHVQRAVVQASSGNADLDSAAARAARTLRFTPPYTGTEPRCGWIALPIRFTTQ